MRHPCSGVILAGGLSTRYGGENKAFLRVGGMRILDRLFAVYRQIFDEIILVTNNPVEFLEWDALIVSDIFPVRSSLTGVHAGLFYASHPFAFFSACDTPFLKKEIVETVLERIDPADDLAGIDRRLPAILGADTQGVEDGRAGSPHLSLVRRVDF